MISIVSSQNKRISPDINVRPTNSYDFKIVLKQGIPLYQYEVNSALEGDYNILIFYKDSSKKDSIINDSDGPRMTLQYDLPFSKYKTDKNIEIGIFKNGFKNGLWETKQKNRIVKKENWRHGLITGDYRVYSTKNEILYSTSFGTSGNGIFKDYYYEIGELKEEGRYKKGKKEGEWCTYLKDGTLDKQINYTDGNPDTK
ncbi:toxin-antitoxin system YwqK family antitoxin [Cellulophaga algicola]|nr:hypothetical protein [Cellulophaga algicola]